VRNARPRQARRSTPNAAGRSLGANEAARCGRGGLSGRRGRRAPPGAARAGHAGGEPATRPPAGSARPALGPAPRRPPLPAPRRPQPSSRPRCCSPRPPCPPPPRPPRRRRTTRCRASAPTWTPGRPSSSPPSSPAGGLIRHLLQGRGRSAPEHGGGLAAAEPAAGLTRGANPPAGAHWHPPNPPGCRRLPQGAVQVQKLQRQLHAGGGAAGWGGLGDGAGRRAQRPTAEPAPRGAGAELPRRPGPPHSPLAPLAPLTPPCASCLHSDARPSSRCVRGLQGGAPARAQQPALCAAQSATQLRPTPCPTPTPQTCPTDP
jgi:hypothetical protein